MKKHVLISAAFIDGAGESDFITCCAAKLKELGLHVSMHSTPDCSVIMAAQPEVTQAPAELPPPPAEMTAQDEPAPAPEPAEPPAVEVEVETPAGEVEVEVELPVKFEARLLNISGLEVFECYATEADVSMLPVGDLDTDSTPGAAAFTLFGLTYKIPLDESGCFPATISVNGATKHTKLRPVQAVDEAFLPYQIVIGKNDAELLVVN